MAQKNIIEVDKLQKFESADFLYANQNGKLVQVPKPNIPNPDDFPSVYDENKIKKLESYARELSKSVANTGILSESNGSQIVLNDSSNLPINELHLFGRSTQVKTSGKNLLDWSIVANGSTNPDTGQPYDTNTRLMTNDFVSLKKGTYTISYDVANDVVVDVYDLNKQFIKSESFVGWNKSPFSFPINDSRYVRILFRYTDNKDIKVSDGKFNAMLNEGSTALPYEPYSGGKTSPSPEYPQEIKSVDNAEVRVTGKNLLPYPYSYTTRTSNGITFTDNGDGTIRANGTSTANAYFIFGKTILPIGTYSYSIQSSKDITLYVQIDGKDRYINGTEVGKFTLLDSKEVILAMYVPNGRTIENAKVCPMIYKVSDGSYESSKSQTLTDNHTLRGIPVSSGGNYTDENGQQWIADELIRYADGSGKLIRRCEYYVIKGGSSWKKSSAYKGNFHCNRYDFTPTIKGNFNAMLCNKAVNVKNVNDLTTIGSCYVDGSININLFGDISLDEFNQKISEMYSNGNPVIIVAILETPTTESLTPLEVDEILHTNRLTTVITNTSDAHMDVSYAVDLKTYIDNK